MTTQNPEQGKECTCDTYVTEPERGIGCVVCGGLKPTPAREAHNTTPEQCMALVPAGFVCPGCGGTLEPIDTVDNAGTPTYWAGCNVCHKFSWGVSAEAFDTARWLVDERKENFYHDLDASRESQIRGWTGIVGEIIRRALSTRETEIAKENEVLKSENKHLAKSVDMLLEEQHSSEYNHAEEERGLEEELSTQAAELAKVRGEKELMEKVRAEETRAIAELTRWMSENFPQYAGLSAEVAVRRHVEALTSERDSALLSVRKSLEERLRVEEERDTKLNAASMALTGLSVKFHGEERKLILELASKLK